MVHSDEGVDRTGRREFLTRCSAAAAAGLLSGGAAVAADSPRVALPTIALGPHRVSRLIVGSNPISGYSYLGPEVDREMKAYFTPGRTLAFLQQCERAGINTHQFSSASKATEIYRTLRQQGSKLQLIGLLSKPEDIQRVAKTLQPIAMAHHGGATDRLFGEGRSGQVRDFVKAVHDRGLLAGVSAHNPDCVKRIADEGWDVDFFMTCFYYLTRPKLSADSAPAPEMIEAPVVNYKFYKTDPAAMCKVIRRVKQPCLAFKILGAGRRCADRAMVREAFRFAFEQIKPGDAAIVGMYPRHFDQVRANAQHARQLGAAT